MEQNNNMDKSNSGGMGPLIGSILVIIILIVGAIYFWGSKITPKDIEPEPAAALSSSDSYDSLEADLRNTQTIDIDTNF